MEAWQLEYHFTYDNPYLDFEFINEEMKAIEEYSNKMMKVEIDEYEFLVDAYGQALYEDCKAIKSHTEDKSRLRVDAMTFP
ncbi:hypothetical protein [Halobacillus mangrovi]|uniref:hypothetical protein n=1 Tax=Halobacillus mangrovi TaxID=402384 RepID=UPI003D95F61B